MVNFYYIYGGVGYYILWLNVKTFMVGFYYLHGGYYIYGSYCIYGWYTRRDTHIKKQSPQSGAHQAANPNAAFQ